MRLSCPSKISSKMKENENRRGVSCIKAINRNSLASTLVRNKATELHLHGCGTAFMSLVKIDLAKSTSSVPMVACSNLAASGSI